MNELYCLNCENNTTSHLLKSLEIPVLVTICNKLYIFKNTFRIKEFLYTGIVLHDFCSRVSHIHKLKTITMHGTRTTDLQFTKPLLYPSTYSSYKFSYIYNFIHSIFIVKRSVTIFALISYVMSKLLKFTLRLYFLQKL